MTNKEQRKLPPGDKFGLRAAIREIVLTQISYEKNKYKTRKK